MALSLLRSGSAVGAGCSSAARALALTSCKAPGTLAQGSSISSLGAVEHLRCFAHPFGRALGAYGTPTLVQALWRRSSH